MWVFRIGPREDTGNAYFFPRSPNAPQISKILTYVQLSLYDRPTPPDTRELGRTAFLTDTLWDILLNWVQTM